MSQMVKPLRDRLLAEFHLFTRANPLSRPRTTKSGKFYQPKDNQKIVIEAMKLYPECQIGGPVIMDCVVSLVRLPGEKSRWPTSKRYGDKDNLEKGIADNLVSTGHLVDDSIILGGEMYKIFGDENYIDIQIYAVKE